ncbi:MAG: outer membrane protein assembly factor BamA [Opitutales bacterium]
MKKLGWILGILLNSLLLQAQESTWNGELLPLQQLQIELQGYKNISEDYVRAQLGFKEGDHVRGKDLDSASEQLYKTGWFNELHWFTEVDSGKLKVRLQGKICPRIETFQFIGNKHFRDNELLYGMKSRVNQPMNESQLVQDLAVLKRFYQSKGYCKVEAKVRTKPSKTGYHTVIFEVKEGPCLRIKDIRFEGVSVFEAKELLEHMCTKPWGWLSWLTKTGRFDEAIWQKDLEKIETLYRNKGYLDVEIEHAKIRLLENGNLLRIVIPVSEGICYKIHQVALNCDQADDLEALRKCVQLKDGNIASPEKIEEACERIRDFYGRYGYIDAEVNVARKWVAEGLLDLHFQVTRGLQYRIHSLYLTGNIHTQARVILREMNLAPGDILDRTRIKKAEQRLYNTGFFKSVQLAPEDSSSPCEKDIKVVVEENPTGSIYFSGALNSVEKFTFGVTLSQNNFDYKNSKDYFRGAGQKFQINTSFGKYSNEVGLSFEEPWLFDRELRFGFNLFRNMSKFDSDHFKEIRLGGEVYLAKRLFEQVEGRLYYHLEQFKLTDVHSADVSQVIKNEEGKRTISKIGFLLERDTRDQFIYPTCGTYLVWDNQWAGLGGATKYLRTNFTAARWFLISPEYEQTFLIGGKTGFVRGLSGQEVPLFEREFLGGPDNLRGFDYREVGPKTNDQYHENLGGKRFAYLKSEYSVKVHSIVRLVGFFDIGQVKELNNKYLDTKSGGWNSDAGFGLRIHVLGAPFRLDFAFPLKTDSYNKKKAPHIVYSFGVSF